MCKHLLPRVLGATAHGAAGGVGGRRGVPGAGRGAGGRRRERQGGGGRAGRAVARRAQALQAAPAQGAAGARVPGSAGCSAGRPCCGIPKRSQAAAGLRRERAGSALAATMHAACTRAPCSDPQVFISLHKLCSALKGCGVWHSSWAHPLHFGQRVLQPAEVLCAAYACISFTDSAEPTRSALAQEEQRLKKEADGRQREADERSASEREAAREAAAREVRGRRSGTRAAARVPGRVSARAQRRGAAGPLVVVFRGGDQPWRAPRHPRGTAPLCTLP